MAPTFLVLIPAMHVAPSIGADWGEIQSLVTRDLSDTGEKEERETKDKVEGCVQEGHADCRTERGR